MPGAAPRSSVWPDEAQERLIDAALGEQGAAGLDRLPSLDTLDAASQRLLPLLARRLARTADNRIVQGTYRHSWVRNQLLFARVAPALLALERAGIRTLVLKGVALSLLHYRDPGARPMEDADLLVRPDEMAGAVAVLRGLGWQPQGEPRSWPPPHQPAWPLVGPGGAVIDLHGYALAGEQGPQVDLGFWDRAVPVQLGGARTLALGPTDQLFHVVAHGLRWNAYSPIRWVADALVVLRSVDHLQWDELRATAAARRRTRSLLAGLSYLRARFGAEVPDSFLEALRAAPVSRSERLEHFFALRDHSGALGTLPNLWFGYRATAARRDAGFLRYLQEVWELDGHRALARTLAGKAARRAWHSLRHGLVC